VGDMIDRKVGAKGVMVVSWLRVGGWRMGRWLEDGKVAAWW